MRRNIVNISQINENIALFCEMFPEWSQFVHGSLRNYLLREAPVKIDFKYYFLFFKKNISNKENKILKNGFVFHYVDVYDKSLIDQIVHVLEFLNQNYNKYIKKQHLSYLYFFNKYLKSMNYLGSQDIGIVEVCHEFSDGFKIVKLIDRQSQVLEGMRMKNCLKEQSHLYQQIYSIRNQNDKSIVTLSVENKKVTEMAEKCNKIVSDRNFIYVKKFCDKNLYYINRDHLSMMTFRVSNFIMFLGLFVFFFITTATFILINSYKYSETITWNIQKNGINSVVINGLILLGFVFILSKTFKSMINYFHFSYIKFLIRELMRLWIK